MTNSLHETIKDVIHKLSDEELMDAFNDLEIANDKLGNALLIDEIETRYPDTYNRFCDPETYELNKAGLIEDVKKQIGGKPT